MGLMTTRDFETYESLFTSIKSMIQAPDLMVYLRGSIPTLVSRIQKRGREYEDSIRLDYLKRLNERYEAWITKYDEGPLLIIDVDDIDFESNPEDLGDVIKKIDAQLHGLF
jgi:deoxyadenosine/deoxycytidine kinase